MCVCLCVCVGVFRVVCVHGGVERYEQMESLSKGADLLVATPGRLLDFTCRGICTLSGCHGLVVGEADRMLALKFEKDLKRLYFR